MRKYLASVTWWDRSGNPGFGRTFLASSGPLTQMDIEETEGKLADAGGYRKLVITGLSEIEPDEADGVDR